jgi:hypothetical protein
VKILPLRADQVSPEQPFDDGELLYRRISPDELNSKGEIDPSRIQVTGFTKDINSSPSVNRGAFSLPEDVLSMPCAGKDVQSWTVFFLQVQALPKGLLAGDGRAFDFFPHHAPLEMCGAHSVIASCLAANPNQYAKPTRPVVNDFKVKFAVALTRMDQLFDIITKEKISTSTQ